MNKIASKIGDNFQHSLIIEQENKLIEEFSIPRLCKILEIPEYRFYDLKKSGQPKVSIIIKVDNNCQFLDRCLESLILQNEKDIEIILVDCTSLDDCKRLIQLYSKRDERVVVVEHRENKKHLNALSAGIDIASAPWFMIIDSNDYIDNCAIKNIFKKIHGIPQIGLVVCGAMGLSEDGRILKITNCPTENMLIEDSFNHYRDHHLLYMPDKIGAKMWRRNIFNDNIKLRSLNMEPSENPDWFIHIISNLRHSTLFIKDRMYYYGTRPDNILIDSMVTTPQLTQAEIKTTSNLSHYHFRRLGFSKKIWSTAVALSKILKLYRTLRPFVIFFKHFIRVFGHSDRGSGSRFWE